MRVAALHHPRATAKGGSFFIAANVARLLIYLAADVDFESEGA
jgi:hypothetical protein